MFSVTRFSSLFFIPLCLFALLAQAAHSAPVYDGPDSGLGNGLEGSFTWNGNNGAAGNTNPWPSFTHGSLHGLDGNAEIGVVSGNANIGNVSGNARIGDIPGNARIGDMSGFINAMSGGLILDVTGGNIDAMAGGGIDAMTGGGITNMYGGRVRIYNNARINSLSGGFVELARDQDAKIGSLSGSASFGFPADNLGNGRVVVDNPAGGSHSIGLVNRENYDTSIASASHTLISQRTGSTAVYSLEEGARQQFGSYDYALELEAFNNNENYRLNMQRLNIDTNIRQTHFSALGSSMLGADKHVELGSNTLFKRLVARRLRLGRR